MALAACGGGVQAGGSTPPQTTTSPTPPPATPPDSPPATPPASDPPPVTPPPSTAPACLASPLLSQLGKSKLLVGADMADAVAQSASFDVRYMYLAGGLADGAGTCSSCASGCTAAGASCANSGAGCDWWGCWQDDTKAPGQYVRDLLAKTLVDGQVPMITYYELLHTSLVAEGAPEVVVMT